MPTAQSAPLQTNADEQLRCSNTGCIHIAMFAALERGAAKTASSSFTLLEPLSEPLDATLSRLRTHP